MAMYGNLDTARAGMLDGLAHDFVSKRTAVAFKFGDPAFVDAGNETDIVQGDVTDTSLVFQGVVVLTQYADNTVEGELPAKHVASVVREGEIWIRVPDAETATANLPAYAITNTANAEYGKFTKLSTNAAAVSTGCIFTSNPVTLGAGQTFARIRVNGAQLAVAGVATAVAFASAAQIGGSTGTVTTTGLTLTFGADPTSLTIDNITVTGATKGELTGTGTTRVLTITDITVADGDTVSVAITNPTGFAISGSPKTAVVYVAS